MESKKLFCVFVVSLLVIEDSMASRILAENSPPDKNGNRISVVGSEPKRDKSRRGGGSDSGTVPVPPPVTETTISQAGQPNTSASAIAIAPIAMLKSMSPPRFLLSVPLSKSSVTSTTTRTSLSRAISKTSARIPNHPRSLLKKNLGVLSFSLFLLGMISFLFD